MERLITLWLLFFITHSGLAATRIKALFAPIFKNFYRIFYNIVALSIMALILCTLMQMRHHWFFEPPFLLKILGLCLIFAGFWVTTKAFQYINLSSFLGFSSADESNGQLVTEGAYRWVRHPLYWGTTLFLIGGLCILPTDAIAVSVGFSLVYIIIGIEFEEKKLRRTYGASYDDFSRNKKKFIPFVY
jgi:protein-S-isoprenylcysteine O-methyltransferase Ste14